jgi:hypothetical protein
MEQPLHSVNDALSNTVLFIIRLARGQPVQHPKFFTESQPATGYNAHLFFTLSRR